MAAIAIKGALDRVLDVGKDRFQGIHVGGHRPGGARDILLLQRRLAGKLDAEPPFPANEHLHGPQLGSQARSDLGEQGEAHARESAAEDDDAHDDRIEPFPPAAGRALRVRYGFPGCLDPRLPDVARAEDLDVLAAPDSNRPGQASAGDEERRTTDADEERSVLLHRGRHRRPGAVERIERPHDTAFDSDTPLCWMTSGIHGPANA